jgi:Phospholipase_D-nuclease N-terminal
VLAAAAAAPLFTLYALIVCIRTKIERRKWLWILFILFGFGRFMVNWTTGSWDFHIFYAQLLSASAGAAFFGPWIISVSLPVGAVFFLSRRKKLEAYKPPNGGAATEAGPTSL